MAAEIDVLVAIRQQLTNTSSITSIVPAERIYIGPRRHDMPLPSICISTTGTSWKPESQGGRVRKDSTEDYDRWHVRQGFSLEITLNSSIQNMITLGDLVISALMKDSSYSAGKFRRPVISDISDVFDESRRAIVRTQRWTVDYTAKL
jgi:hypothetical protein